jgi:hypothetical protein
MRQGRKAQGRRGPRHDMRSNGFDNAAALRPAQQLTTSWAEMTQVAMQDWVSMWSGAAQESLRFVTELQQANVEAARLLSQAVGRLRRAA